MTYYRVTSGDQDVFAAIKAFPPEDQEIIDRKPDSSWLPKVKKKFTKQMWFWTEEGMEKYASSGLKDWHEMALATPLEVHMVDELPGRILYQNKYQIFTQ